MAWHGIAWHGMAWADQGSAWWPLDWSAEQFLPLHADRDRLGTDPTNILPKSLVNKRSKGPSRDPSSAATSPSPLRRGHCQPRGYPQPQCHVPQAQGTADLRRHPSVRQTPDGGGAPGGVVCGQGRGVRAQCGVNRRLISHWSFPLQTIRQCPARSRLRNQRRGGEVVIFGFSAQ